MSNHHTLKFNAGSNLIEEVDSFFIETDKYCFPNQVTISGEKIVISGQCLDAKDDSYTVIRVSKDDGKTWKSVDQHKLSVDQIVEETTGAPDGAPIFRNFTATSENGRQSSMRRSIDGGNTFQTIDAFRYNSLPTQSNGYAVVDTKVVITASQFIVSGTEAGIAIRKSVDGGATFSTQAILGEPGRRLRPFRVRSTKAGIFVIGAQNYEGKDFAMVWLSKDGGTTWNESDAYSPEGSTGNITLDLTQDSSGTLWSASYSGGSIGTCVVRTSKDLGKTWDLESTFSGAQNLGAVCYALGINAQDELHLTGVSALEGKNEVFVRRIAQ